MNRTTEKIPTWSLCYLINGDATALTDEEIRMVDEWVSQWQVEIVSPLMVGCSKSRKNPARFLTK